MGKLSTLFGPRRVFQAGILILLAAGLLGTLAPGFGYLLVSRALIGIGTSAAYPTAMALVRKRADDAQVGVPSRVLGNFSIAAQVTAVIGLPLGGILAGAFTWRGLFFVNVPLALITFILTSVGVAKDDPIDREGQASLLTAIDIPGIVLFAGAITSLLVFLSDLKSPIWWVLGVAVVLFAALILWERRAARPLIDVRMLGKNRPLQRTYIRQLLFGLGTYAALYGTSQWMEQARGLDAGTVGLILIPFSAVSIVLARVVSGKAWVRWPLILAGVALVLTAITALLITHSSSILVLVGMTLLFGLTNGLNSFANQATLYVQAPAAEIAVASGLYRTSAYIGAIFSSSIIGLAFGDTVSDAGLHTLGWVLAAIGAVVTLLTVFDRHIPMRAV
jgi:predicted MFS family arabinose efflux permease